MTAKKHGGRRAGAGQPPCKIDRLAAMIWADEFGVGQAYARQMLREDRSLLSPCKWRAVGICVECGQNDTEAMRILRTIL